jgi:membrane protease YdiL (CAAX protease family)
MLQHHRIRRRAGHRGHPSARGIRSAFLPALAIMILLNNGAEEIGWTGFVFARFQDRHGPLRAAVLTTVFFWLFHVPSFYVETRS